MILRGWIQVAVTKFLSEEGVKRLWAAIEAKFIDTQEIADLLVNVKPGEDMEALTNPEIDAITGYAAIENVEQLLQALQNKNVSAIEITKDIVLDEPVELGEGKSLVLTLKNNIVNSGASAAFVVNGGSLVINGNGGSIIGANQAVAVQSGSAVVNGGFYQTTSAGQVMCAVGENSTLVLNNVTLNGQEAAVMAFDGATLTVNGGEYTTVDNFAIGTNGSAGRGGNTIYVNGVVLNGNISSAGYEACGIYIANNDTVIVDGETVINVEKGCGILMRAGNVTVKAGAQINTTAAEAPGWVGDNKTKMSQAGIIYHEAANYPGKEGMSLTVEEGVVFNCAGENVEIISNEETPNVHYVSND